MYSHQVFVGWFRPKAIAPHHLTLTFVSSVRSGEANPQPQDHGLLHQLPLHDAALGLEDVLHQHHRHHHSEPWITNGFDATRDPFDMLQFSGSSQPCGLLLSSTGARL